MNKAIWFIITFLCTLSLYAQIVVEGRVSSAGGPLAFAHVYIKEVQRGVVCDEEGYFQIESLPYGIYTLLASYTGYEESQKRIDYSGTLQSINFKLEATNTLDQVVVTGTMKAVNRLESPVPVEVYSPTFLKKNPTPNVFEALQNVNGVRPQLNCNVCNTGDIHINGLEGPYTMVLIDGMPIVSGLSTVYGLSGIPNSLIEQIEIVKGPASSLYGSEAVGGLINITTKLPDKASRLTLDSYATSWGASNTDVGLKIGVSEKVDLLLGSNYFFYNTPKDENGDNFTDVTLQERFSLFQKWDLDVTGKRDLSLAGRFFYEDRWGGEMQWNPSFRGGTEIYGESIYTTRYEVIGRYQLPVKPSISFQTSFSFHDQNSVYGDVPYLAKQHIVFGQFLWDTKLEGHDVLIGLAGRYNYYNDNTPATPSSDRVFIPSLFVQDEWEVAKSHRLLLGARYDYDNRHGSIFTPRVAYRFKPSEDDVLRLNAGTGFRVVNLFTEDHAALTGAREVVVLETLKPERSYNVNLNYMRKFYLKQGMIFTVDASAWYTHFTNAILPDYDTNPNQILYDNLDGYATSKGISVNFDAHLATGFKVLLGATFQDVNQIENGISTPQILTERFTGTWALSYKHYPSRLTLDYTGNIYGPMRLPLLGPLDPRQEYSPTWSIQNIQLTFNGFDQFEMYGGVKNVLNWTPNKGNPFLIARSEDPFDENVVFDNQGNVVPTQDNPYALTFDPSYVYAPNQGRHLFLGIRYELN